MNVRKCSESYQILATGVTDGRGKENNLYGSVFNEPSSSREGNNDSAVSEILRLLCTPTFYCLIHKGRFQVLKAVPLQAWSSPEGSRKLRFPDFLTTAQDGGKIVSLTHWPHLSPGDTPGTHFC
jgi:hypothetical protein